MASRAFQRSGFVRRFLEVARVAARSTNRVKLSQSAKDILWSESGGHCQNPGCRVDLHAFVDQVHVAELAHIIPASTKGPRATEGPDLTESERADPTNILVLCPTCHTMIDKGPSQYPAGILRRWKERSQRARAIAFGTPQFTSRDEARAAIEPLLGANRAVFQLYGPLDDVFDDTRADQWSRHVVDTVIPNNRALLDLLQSNRDLLTVAEKATLDIFAIHAQQLEERHLEGNWTPGSTRFPEGIDSIMKGDT
ncbi:HNH endonuclease signature motif containing protein [Streptomyces sp. NBC_00670]|uniref:HNH endonuclease signature motif containing protein n=1 Tax=Streptomyces sp. NBC_00670 TaxID=2975804 RepID=UPI002E379C57|nr:HNH endonuclease signature motif containing protein [Streptomyces sp. NBC_00670]